MPCCSFALDVDTRAALSGHTASGEYIEWVDESPKGKGRCIIKAHKHTTNLLGHSKLILLLIHYANNKTPLKFI